MAFRDLFRKPAAAPIESSVMPLNSIDSLTAWMGGLSTAAATREEAMAVPTIARARNVLCATGASLPLITRITNTGAKVPSARVITQPDSRMIGAATYAWLLEDIWLYGRGYMRITAIYADDGRASDTERINPIRISPQMDRLGINITGWYVDGIAAPATGLGSLIVYNGLDEGLLNRAGRTIRAAFELEKAALMYAKEPVPQMVLSSNGVTLPPDRITTLLAGWKKARETRSTAFLNADIKLDKLSIDPKALQLNEARQYVALELCRTAGLPAYFASAELNTMTYSNAITERRSLIDFGLRNILTVIEQTLSLPIYTASTTEVKFDMDDFLRGNPLERAQVYQILSGITDKAGEPAMTVQEIRKSEDMLL